MMHGDGVLMMGDKRREGDAARALGRPGSGRFDVRCVVRRQIAVLDYQCSRFILTQIGAMSQ